MGKRGLGEALGTQIPEKDALGSLGEALGRPWGGLGNPNPGKRNLGEALGTPWRGLGRALGEGLGT